MKTLSVSLTFALAASALLAADVELKTAVTDAAKKLAGEPNYAWTTTAKTEGSSSMGPIEGKSEKDGCIHFSGSLGDNKFEVVLQGDKLAVNWQDEWKSASELDNDRMVKRLKSFKAPAAEAADLAGKVKGFKKEADGALAGELTAEAVKEVYGRFGRGRLDSGTQGTVKFWVKNGGLAKYEYVVKGKAIVGEDEREVEIDRTVAVEIKDVGKTKLSLPAEAKQKLS